MKAIIDRFEGDFAVCEVAGEKRMINLEKAKLPAEAKEGDVLDICDTGISVDTGETDKRSKHIKSLLNSLWE